MADAEDECGAACAGGVDGDSAATIRGRDGVCDIGVSGYALDSTDHNLSCLRDYFIRDWIDLGSLLGQA